MTVKNKEPSVTFEQARDFEYDTQIPDAFIVGALASKLRKVAHEGGSTQLSERENNPWVKQFFDYVPADASDREFAANNQEVIKFRDELTDFVSEELKFYIPPNTPQGTKDYIVQRRNEFRQKIEGDKQKFRDYVKGREQGLSVSQNRLPSDALEFRGMTVPTTEGVKSFLREGSIGGVRANLLVQNELKGRFVHWSSPNYLRARAGGTKPELTKRIYLNPRATDSVKVFKELIAAAAAADLTVKGKILDRSTESNVMKAYNEQNANDDVRGDSIVLYATEAEANALLGLTEQIYINNKASFAGRRLTSVPLKVGEGFGVGDEPDEAKASLTSHRAGVIEGVLREVRDRNLPTKPEQIRLFRNLWDAAARNANINPKNMAFNAGPRRK